MIKSAFVQNGKVIHIGSDLLDAPLDAIYGEYDIVETAKGRIVLSSDYMQLRADEYPHLADQLDMQYHDAIDNGSRWITAIEAVKTKFPKPE